MLTVFCSVKNAAAYAEVFLLSAANKGFRPGEAIRLVMLVGESQDDTEKICRRLITTIPIRTKLIMERSLDRKMRRRVAEINESNAHQFNEGMWDFLRDNFHFHARFYAGIHVDVEFVKPGLWRFLLNRMISRNAVIGSLFDPGELYRPNGNFWVSMPRFFPLVAIARRTSSQRFGINWTRSHCEMCPNILYDNGAEALRAAITSKVRIEVFTEGELKTYIRHFGFVWTRNYVSLLYKSAGQKSRREVAERLRILRRRT
jgi:hypothetical protein